MIQLGEVHFGFGSFLVLGQGAEEFNHWVVYRSAAIMAEVPVGVKMTHSRCQSLNHCFYSAL